MDADYLNMAPEMRYSLVNVRLRNEFDNLQSLADSMGVGHEALVQRLAAKGFCVGPAADQFRLSHH